MRFLLFSFAAILVVCTTANSQLMEGPSNLVDVVTRATDQILAATDAALADVNRQQDLIIGSYENLSSRVGVTGPIPAVVVIAKYLHSNILRFAQIIALKTNSIFASIIASIHDEVQQLTHFSEQDANEVIAQVFQSVDAQIADIRQASNQRLNDILSTAGAIVIRLNQLALQDCGGNLVQLNNKLIEIRQQIVVNIQNEWKQRHASIRKIFTVHINELLTRIQQFGPCPDLSPCYSIY